MSEEQGGLLSLQGLADCWARWQEAISTTYRGHRAYEAPPNSSGDVLLQELNHVEGFDLKSSGCNTAENIHLMMEAKKLAFVDREAYVADPEYIDVPLEGLLSKEYARDWACPIDPERAAYDVRAGNSWSYQAAQPVGHRAKVGAGQEQEHPTRFVVVDGQGNAICQLQSIQSPWGSSLIAGETGILLNNRMTYWHLEENHVDCLVPGKRVRHTMNPVMAFRNSEASGNGSGRQLSLVLGTPGADIQVQTNLQVISHVLDFGMTMAEAVEASRWRNTQNPTESYVPHTCSEELLVESRYSEEVVEGLRKRGHVLNILGGWEAKVGEMMIQVDPDNGALHGGADPRKDRYAAGW